MSRRPIVELRIPSRAEYVSVVRLAISGIAAKMAFSYEEIEDIKLAVSEACTNAILHAPKEEDTQVFICCLREEGKLIIEVSNIGEYFTPERIEISPKITELTESGLGIIIMRSLMDEVEFKPNPVDGTIVRMVKYLGR